MIELKNIKKTYRTVVVVNIPELVIKKGESIGLVGNNGAGKSTMFKIILDLVRPETGKVIINGYPVQGQESWKQYVASYLDENFLIDYLKPEEYFYFIGRLQKKSRQEVDHFLMYFNEFFNGEILKQNKYIRDLSKGNQNKVGITACFLQESEIVILDEPFANIDPSSQIRLKNLLQKLNKNQGITTIVSSHDLNHITEVSDRILLMEKGYIVRDILTNSETLDDLKQYFNVETLSANV